MDQRASCPASSDAARKTECSTASPTFVTLRAVPKFMRRANDDQVSSRTSFSSRGRKTFTYRLRENISGDHVVQTNLSDRRGYAASPKTLKLFAASYEQPNISIQYAIKGANGDQRLAAGEEGDLFVYLKNEGGCAKDVSVNIDCPDDIVVTAGEKRTNIISLPKGESRELQISIVAPARYAEKSKNIPFRISLHSPTMDREKNIQIPLGE